MFEEHSTRATDSTFLKSDLLRLVSEADRQGGFGFRAPKQQILDELSATQLDDLMLGRRSDAIPIKSARQGLGPLLVHQVPTAALRLGMPNETRRGRPLVEARDWKIGRLSENPIHERMNQLVHYGPAYREMPSYKRLLTQASRGKPRICNDVPLDSEAAIDAYFEHYLQLIESIRRSGFLPRTEVPRLTADPLVRRAKTEKEERDVLIAIGPQGELLRLGTGRHRTAIAQALGLERMPVEIRLVHAKWLSKLVERSGKSPLDALVDWFNAAKQNGLYQPRYEVTRFGFRSGHGRDSLLIVVLRRHGDGGIGDPGGL
jgi:hypothetical protein